MTELQSRLLTAIMVAVAIIAWSVMGIFAWEFIEALV